MAHGRHRKKKDSRVKALSVIAVAGTGVAVPATFVGTAHADSSTVWDRLAECESGQDFGIKTPPYYGGFQFLQSTWNAVGGTGNPADATPAEQLKRAKILLAEEGPGQWTCSTMTLVSGQRYAGQYVGLTRENGAAEGLSILGGSGTTTTPAPATGSGTTVNAAKAIAWAVGHANAGDLRYSFGAEGPTAYDCSSFVQAAWRSAGVSIGRDTYEQDETLPHVSQSDMRPGDLILWNFQGTGQPSPNHVTMFIGDGKMVEASGSRGITVSNVSGRGGQIVGVVRPDASSVPSTPTTPTTPPVTTPPTTPPVVSPPATPKPHNHKGKGHWHAPAVPKTAGTYTVVPGDTLSDIAYAHGSSHWGPLYQANRDVVGANPHLIFPGQVLRLLAGSGAVSGHSDHHKATSKPVTPAPVDTPTPAPSQTASPSPTTTPGQVADYVSPVAQAPGYAFGVINGSYSAGFHTGTDFPVPVGTPVHAVAAGTVIVGGQGAAYGNHIVIHHPDGKYTLYAHLSRIDVTDGATVAAGDVIGMSGATGNVTGPHLHFEVRNTNTYGDVIDPVKWLRSHGVSI
ncbi:peptidoglycan DD-metalloendopeptidase family protein [Streptomyces sp. NPDC048211]|uniref:peptidoglycan DD-metalloendopeptidase family protein n=1 Tax=Streptomyces sp. NPDC048211 TaxID=3365516 RepID=UPI00371690D7